MYFFKKCLCNSWEENIGSSRSAFCRNRKWPRNFDGCILSVDVGLPKLFHNDFHLLLTEPCRTFFLWGRRLPFGSSLLLWAVSASKLFLLSSCLHPSLFPGPLLLPALLLLLNYLSEQLTSRRRSRLCGKWDYETELLLTWTDSPSVHDTVQCKQ